MGVGTTTIEVVTVIVRTVDLLGRIGGGGFRGGSVRARVTPEEEMKEGFLRIIKIKVRIFWVPRSRRPRRARGGVALAGVERVTVTPPIAPTTATPTRAQVVAVLTAEKRGEREAESRSSR